jgi:hypothetical protein
MESLSLDQKRNYLRVFEQCFSHENEEKLTAEANIKGCPGEKTEIEYDLAKFFPDIRTINDVECYGVIKDKHLL